MAIRLLGRFPHSVDECDSPSRRKEPCPTGTRLSDAGGGLSAMESWRPGEAIARCGVGDMTRAYDATVDVSLQTSNLIVHIGSVRIVRRLSAGELRMVALELPKRKPVQIETRVHLPQPIADVIENAEPVWGRE